jgi:hypothetical protein
MTKFAIRFLTLAKLFTASSLGPMIAAAHAATEGTQVKKKHKTIHGASSRATAPKVSNEIPRNYSDDPDRRAAGGGY